MTGIDPVNGIAYGPARERARHAREHHDTIRPGMRVLVAAHAQTWRGWPVRARVQAAGPWGGEVVRVTDGWPLEADVRLDADGMTQKIPTRYIATIDEESNNV